MNKFSRWLPITLGLLALIVLPQFVHNAYYLHLVETILIYSILLFGLDIVVGYTGLVSLGHSALFGVGSYTVGVLFFKLGLPFYITLPASIVVTAGFGALLALPALRVTGPYLAMVTLAFGTILQILINEMTFLTEGPLGIKIGKPVLFDMPMSKVAFFYFVVACVVLSLWVMQRIIKSHYGRAFEALRDSPIACDCMGVSVYRYKVIAFILSAAFAGLSGGLYAYSEQYIAPNAYNFELTILFLLAIIMGGRKSRSGAFLGALIVVMLPSLLADIELFRWIAYSILVIVLLTAIISLVNKQKTWKQLLIPIAAAIGVAVFAKTLDNITDWRLTIFGVMTLFVVYYLQEGIVGYATKLLPRRKHNEQFEQLDVELIKGGKNASGPLLKADQILMQFGGLKALNRVDLLVQQGHIHGLIGPNGSGKSTMMNVITGIYQPTEGAVHFYRQGQALQMNGLTPSAIALNGIARTFQNVQLFGEMTTLENILVGLHHTFKSNLLDVVLLSPRYRREERYARARAAAILTLVGLQTQIAEEARNLPYGKQRLLEIGRALGLDAPLLLLDEPAAGLTAPDIKELVMIIRKIRDCGITLLLIEHHMDVVMSICDRVTVLDFGQKIAEGTGNEVRTDPKVISAYLGGDVESTATSH